MATAEKTIEHPTAVDLSKYIEASPDRYMACLDSIDHDLKITNVDATLRFHHLQFDTNGEPKLNDLACCLADHIIEYCFSLQRRGKPTSLHEISRLNRKARMLLRRFYKSGESGDMLLYFLLETVIKAPQMVAKMDLKTNPKMEYHGSDGIHMKWHETDNLLDIYFGESKLEHNVSTALSNLFKSLASFHENGLLDHELGLVTSHYKWADDNTKRAVLQYLDRQKPGGDCRINHACLIGYNWDEYKKLNSPDREDFIENFKDIYKNDTKRLYELIQRRFNISKLLSIRFDVFFLPFKNVQDFRDAFNKAINARP